MKARKDGRFPATQWIEGRKVYAYGKTPEEAAANLEEKLKSIHLTNKLDDTPATPVTLHDLAKSAWWPWMEARVAAGAIEPETFARYKDIYKRYVRDGLGRLPLESVTEDDVQMQVYAWGAAGVAASTVHNVVGIIRAAYRQGRRRKLTKNNPTIELEMPTKTAERHRPMSVDQAAELLHKVDGTPLSCPVFMAVFLGMREGEICGCPRENVDTTALTVTVDRQYCDPKIKGEKPYMKMHTKGGEGKGGRKPRVIPLDKDLMDELLRRADPEFKYLVSYKRYGVNKDMLLPGKLSKLWLAERSRLGYPEYTFHDLRHAAASVMVDAGTHPIIAKEVLGHKRLKQTEDYTRAPDSAKRLAVETVSLAFKNANDRLL